MISHNVKYYHIILLFDKNTFDTKITTVILLSPNFLLNVFDQKNSQLKSDLLVLIIYISKHKLVVVTIN